MDESDRFGSFESPLLPAIVRGLGDRSYDKRKNAALEVTVVIKNLQERNDIDKMILIIKYLTQEFARSKNYSYRKGGLIALAAAAIGLTADIDRYLNILIPPVIECFEDNEHRVCYYACEAMYNIAKVAKASVLRYFNQIFDGLCKLFANNDPSVKASVMLHIPR